jgi:hypothetical protein
MPLTKPVDPKCDARGLTFCPQLPDWDGSFSDAKRLLKLYGAMYEECEQRRAVLQSCVDSLAKRHVIATPGQ